MNPVVIGTWVGIMTVYTVYKSFHKTEKRVKPMNVRNRVRQIEALNARYKASNQNKW